MGQKEASLDHLIGAAEQHRWHFEAERFRGLEIYHQLEFGRLVKWDISGISTFQNHSDEVSEAAEDVHLVDRISHQSANVGKFAERIDCWNPALRRQFNNHREICDVLGLFRYHEPARSILFQRPEGALILCLVKGVAQYSR